MFLKISWIFTMAKTKVPDLNNIHSLQIKLQNSGIVRSYAKVPVEIKNMFPSNVAYKQLYEV